LFAVWELVLYYYELALLHVIGHEGTYDDRVFVIDGTIYSVVPLAKR
jgi:hypothetical protein